MKVNNILKKKTNKRLVYGSRLMAVIDILSDLDLEITGVKKYRTVVMDEEGNEDTLYIITYKATKEEEFDVMFELCKDPQIGGAVSNC